MNIKTDYQKINNELLQLLPQKQVEEVFCQDMCDIEPDFLGFVHIYYHLSQIIPLHFTVVDFGCAYNPQCFYFKKHKQYIAVDLDRKTKRFQAANCKIYNMTIANFIDQNIESLNIPETFAICSYVPQWHNDNMELVRNNFKNVFTYYPHGGYKI